MEYILADQGGTYLNESERNVHVWCSSMKYSVHRRFNGQVTLGLVAGCYVDDDGPTVSVFYQWLRLIMDPVDDAGHQYDLANMVLFRCPDPRTMQMIPGPIHLPPGVVPLQRDSTHPMRSGHYMLFYEYHGFQHIWVKLHSGDYPPRTRTATQTATPSTANSNRDMQTRDDVRRRDLQCVVTGQVAHARDRGANFTGLEVAHIFPLKGVNHPQWVARLSPVLRQLVSDNRSADQPYNAFLLRADLHSLFDDYQWGIWVGRHNELKIFRFEKSGATTLTPIQEFDPPSSTLPHRGLLLHHFQVALLKHVRGFGQPKKPGAIIL